ncbi:MAG: hypothetical protein HOG49_40060 [Candidatus Scalindua sp.]|nr:hypothetical protein [Candidatus Scalindua sp.]
MPTNDFVNISDMEVFKEGTHNGHKFTPEDIDGIVSNFNTLKNQLTPKVKISHGVKQESIAGLASYGDVTKVVSKSVDGIRKIFVDLTNVPDQVAQWIKDRRFGERSVEIFPNIKIGGKNFKNVLAKVALLGHQIPAVAGMSPVTVNLSIDNEFEESGIEIESSDVAECFEYTLEGKDNIVIFNSESEGKLDKKVLDEIASLQTQMKGLEGKLTTDEGKQMFNDLKTKLESFEKRVEASETGKKSAEENAIKLSADNEKLTGEVDSYKKKEEDAMVKLKAEKTSNFVADLKKNGKITPAVEEELTMFLNSLDDSDEALEFTTKLQGGGDVKQKFTRLETAKRILSRLSKVVEFGELAGGDTDLENPEGGKLDNFVEIQGTTYQVDGLAEEKAIQQYMVENKVGELEATRVILDAKEKRENK